MFRIETPEGLLDRVTLELPSGATVSALLDALELVHDPESMLLAVNRRVVHEDRELMEGDEVRLMPAIEGGASIERLWRTAELGPQ